MNSQPEIPYGYKLDWSLEPKLKPRLVVSMVCGSRTGSSIIKKTLGLHPQISVLDGEEEPYYKLACNGYPWHPSDEFHTANNPELIRCLIANELALSLPEVRDNRKILQTLGIEEKPWVEELRVKRVQPEQVEILLLKTPQNCYRKGVMEQLFPDSSIIYISCRRDFVCTVNGLLDGWESKDFSARSTPYGWWKFDMPPSWLTHAYNTQDPAGLIHTCTFQASSARQFIKDHSVSISVPYEGFLENHKYEVTNVWRYLGLPVGGVHIPLHLEGTMITVPDEQGLPYRKEIHTNRWKWSRPWLEDYLFKYGERIGQNWVSEK